MAESISMYVPTAIIAAISVPIVLKLVPPNRVYGVRTSQTLAIREVWFRVNLVTGFALIAAAGTAKCFYIGEPAIGSGQRVLPKRSFRDIQHLAVSDL